MVSVLWIYLGLSLITFISIAVWLLHEEENLALALLISFTHIFFLIYKFSIKLLKFFALRHASKLLGYKPIYLKHFYRVGANKKEKIYSLKNLIRILKCKEAEVEE